MEITIGAIQDKLKLQLFEQHHSDEFVLKCFSMEMKLKNCISRAFEYLHEHIGMPKLEGQPTHWQNGKIERNVQNLTKYIELLFTKLDKKQIIDYCKNNNSIASVSFEDDEMLFLINSYYGTIILDILWASDISVSDVINISKGIVDKKNLARKLPDKIKMIEKEVIPYLTNQNDYSEFATSINESILSYKKKIYQGASLLIFVAIEGLVRKLGKLLIYKQGLDTALSTKEFNSLDSFLRNIPWKPDIKIEKSRLMFITGDYEFKNDRQVIGNEFVFTDLKTRLDFLRRTFRKERNKTLHGDLNKIGEVWDLYRNYSALHEVYLTIKYYVELE
jgi:hypothetical protein